MFLPHLSSSVSIEPDGQQPLLLLLHALHLLRVVPLLHRAPVRGGLAEHSVQWHWSIGSSSGGNSSRDKIQKCGDVSLPRGLWSRSSTAMSDEHWGYWISFFIYLGKGLCFPSLNWLHSLVVDICLSMTILQEGVEWGLSRWEYKLFLKTVL